MSSLVAVTSFQWTNKATRQLTWCRGSNRLDCEWPELTLLRFFKQHHPPFHSEILHRAQSRWSRTTSNALFVAFAQAFRLVPSLIASLPSHCTPRGAAKQSGKPGYDMYLGRYLSTRSKGIVWLPYPRGWRPLKSTPQSCVAHQYSFSASASTLTSALVYNA